MKDIKMDVNEIFSNKELEREITGRLSVTDKLMIAFFALALGYFIAHAVVWISQTYFMW